MTRRGLAAVALLAALPAGPAAAQGLCLHPAAMADHLATYFGETPRMIGLDAAGALVAIFANAETGTWTLAVTRPGGPTCILASGQDWQSAEPPPGDPA